MKIAICDDDVQYQTQLLGFLTEYVSIHPHIDFSFSAFSCAEDVLNATKKTGDFDVYLLDIIMSGMNGIELGLKLRQSGFTGKIVYLTSSTEYAVDAFKVKASDYLLKPFDKGTVFTTLQEITNAFTEKKENSMIIKTKESSIKISFETILYAELSHRSIAFHLTDGRVIESTTIRTTFSKAIQELLCDKRFLLCGASLVVNLHHITLVENESLSFSNSSRLFLSKKTCREIRSNWYDFWFDKEE